MLENDQIRHGWRTTATGARRRTIARRLASFAACTHPAYSNPAQPVTRVAMPLCRADRVLLSGGAAIAGSTALFGAPLGLAVPAVALLGILADGVFRPSSSVFYP